MPSPALLFTVVRELLTRERVPRVPEPDLVMDDPDKVAAYTRAGREDGVMAPVYLFHCAHVCDVIRPGDTVLDLGCGPATQLALVARLNPQTQFVGVDLSHEMLQRAREHVAAEGLTNITLTKGDITNLAEFADASVDAVMSTVVLHHLPDVAALDRCFGAIARVLKPGGGLYVVDFGRLKSSKSIEYFAYQYADRQPELFTLDYLYSLRAAFSKADFKAVFDRHLAGRATLYSTSPFPFMVAVKTAARREANGDDLAAAALGRLRQAMPRHHRRDFADLVQFFGMGGLKRARIA